MKFILALFLFITLVKGELSTEFQEKVKSEMIKAVTKCTRQEKPTPQDIAALLQRKSPPGRSGKCMISCMYQEFGMQGSDGKITKQRLLSTFEPYKNQDATVYRKTMQIFVDRCLSQVKASDRCEAAAQLADCYHRNVDDDLRRVDAASSVVSQSRKS